MQPHSMCMLALSNYVWNSSVPLSPQEIKMRVEFINREGNYRNLYYRIYNIAQATDGREITAQIVRDGGGLFCKMYARRQSPQEGSEVKMTHDTIHVSGLEEIFYLYKRKITAGRHRNSLKYRRFEGDVITDDRKQVELYCEIMRKDKSWFASKYSLEIETVS